MPGCYCAVVSCKNNKTALKRTGNSDIIFHHFPVAKDLESIQKEWINRCNRQIRNPKNYCICSSHFTPDDYERDLQNEILGLPLRRKLKKNAIPSLNLGTIIDNKIEDSLKIEVSSDPLVENIPKIEFVFEDPNENSNDLSTVKCLMGIESVPEPKAFDASPGQPVENFPEAEVKNPNETSTLFKCLTGIISNSKAIESSSGQHKTCKTIDNNNYKQKYEDLLNKYNTLKLDSRKKIKNSSNLMMYYKNKYYKNPNKKTTKLQITEDILNMVLTKNQINLLSKRKKKVVWTTEEISVAFTIRYYSKKCYVFLRDKLKYPLPALSSLRRWASQLDVSKGMLNEVLTMMKLVGEDLTNVKKTVVLQFDEVKVLSTEEYDKIKNQTLGPHSRMVVVQACGLFTKWKQPVFIAFDQKVTKEVLLNIIKELHNISYNVVACVGDCGDGSIELWKELGVNLEKCFFSHPETNDNIYMFADALHLLKLLRDSLLDTGFILEGKRKITKEPIQKLIDLTYDEVNPCWKINQNHLDLAGSQRQNVRMAAQLLSHNVAEALYLYQPDGDKMCADVSEFIDDVDKWFDILNSYTKDGETPFKSAFGVHLEDQEDHLTKMESTISSMRVTGKGSLENFQIGMLLSMKSLKMLFEDMKKKLNIKYIYTYKLNQNSLQSFFTQLGSSPNAQPSPLTAIHHIRMIFQGKSRGIQDANIDINEATREEYLTPKIFRKVKINMDEKNIHDMTSNSNCSSRSPNGYLESPDDIPSTSGNIVENSFSEMTEDSIEYIAGCLAEKYKQDFPNLGDYACDIDSTDYNYNIPSWVQQPSFGGHIKPSDEWLAKIIEWEEYFIQHHSNGFRKGPGAVKLLATKIFESEDQLPLEIIMEYCELRTAIRLNFNNFQASKKQKLKRKRVISSIEQIESDSNRTKIRKRNKIVN